MRKKEVIKFCLALSLLVLLVILSIYVHEYTHKFDFRELNIMDDKICVLNDCGYNGFPKDLGSYTFNYERNEKSEEIINKKLETAELKAYSVQTIFILFGGFLIKLLMEGID